MSHRKVEARFAPVFTTAAAGEDVLGPLSEPEPAASAWHDRTESVPASSSAFDRGRARTTTVMFSARPSWLSVVADADAAAIANAARRFTLARKHNKAVDLHTQLQLCAIARGFGSETHYCLPKC